MSLRRGSVARFGAVCACVLAAAGPLDGRAGDRGGERVASEAAPGEPVASAAARRGGFLPRQESAAALDPDLLPYPVEGDAARLKSIERGLRWLASRQTARDGSVEVGDAEPGQRAPLAVTSLAALAWMSGGSTPTRGEYQQNVRRAIEYLLACTHRSADEYPGYIQDRGDPISRTHGHGLATLALAQAYTVSPSTALGRRIGETLKLAVQRIVVSQGSEGGWEYHPYRSIQHEGSVTVSLVQALRAANDVGVRVDPEVIDRAVDYIRRIQVMEVPESSADGEAPSARAQLGGFRYGLDDPKTSIALTAAGLTTLQATGVYTGPRIDEGYDFIWRQLAIRAEDGTLATDGFPYYERFYLSQALWQHRDTSHYRRWAEPIMRELVASQADSGSWDDVRYGPKGRKFINRYGAAYATSCNVLFLALPDDTLPLFHR
ncbi:MAG: prenyltransferase/squalene oxidase repeat-containing protein [Planctomycetota bacterium]